MTGQHETPRPSLLARVGAALERPFAAGIDHAAGQPITWTGVDRYGITRTGSKKVLSVPVFIADRHRDRWQELTVTDALGEPLGGITREQTGRRVQWISDEPDHNQSTNTNEAS